MSTASNFDYSGRLHQGKKDGVQRRGIATQSHENNKATTTSIKAGASAELFCCGSNVSSQLSSTSTVANPKSSFPACAEEVRQRTTTQQCCLKVYNSPNANAASSACSVLNENVVAVKEMSQFVSEMLGYSRKATSSSPGGTSGGDDHTLLGKFSQSNRQHDRHRQQRNLSFPQQPAYSTSTATTTTSFPSSSNPPQSKSSITTQKRSSSLGETAPTPTICSLSSGHSHTVCCLTDGSLYSWGCNKDGQLGIEEESSSSIKKSSTSTSPFSSSFIGRKTPASIPPTTATTTSDADEQQQHQHISIPTRVHLPDLYHVNFHHGSAAGLGLSGDDFDDDDFIDDDDDDDDDEFMNNKTAMRRNHFASPTIEGRNRGFGRPFHSSHGHGRYRSSRTGSTISTSETGSMFLSSPTSGTSTRSTPNVRNRRRGGGGGTADPFGSARGAVVHASVNENVSSSAPPSFSPFATSNLGPGGRLSARIVACGAYHTLVVTSSGSLYTFGNNDHGCLGLGDAGISRRTPTMVTNFVSLADDDDKKKKQRHRRRRSSIKNMMTTTTPQDQEEKQSSTTTTTTTTGDRDIHYDHDHEDKHNRNNRDDDDDELDISTIPSCELPTIVSASAGYEHSLVLTKEGCVYAFGRGSEGQLGDGRMGFVAVSAAGGEQSKTTDHSHSSTETGTSSSMVHVTGSSGVESGYSSPDDVELSDDADNDDGHPLGDSSLLEDIPTTSFPSSPFSTRSNVSSKSSSPQTKDDDGSTNDRDGSNTTSTIDHHRRDSSGYGASGVIERDTTTTTTSSHNAAAQQQRPHRRVYPTLIESIFKRRPVIMIACSHGGHGSYAVTASDGYGWRWGLLDCCPSSSSSSTTLLPEGGEDINTAQEANPSDNNALNNAASAINTAIGEEQDMAPRTDVEYSYSCARESFPIPLPPPLGEGYPTTYLPENFGSNSATTAGGNDNVAAVSSSNTSSVGCSQQQNYATSTSGTGTTSTSHLFDATISTSLHDAMTTSAADQQQRPTDLLSFPPKMGRIQSIAAGAQHLVCVTRDGEVYAMGKHGAHLGAGPACRLDWYDEVVQMLLPANILVTGVACGQYHTLLSTTCGRLYGCGDNKNSQLGLQLGNLTSTKDTSASTVPNTNQRLSSSSVVIASSEDHAVPVEIPLPLQRRSNDDTITTSPLHDNPLSCLSSSNQSDYCGDQAYGRHQILEHFQQLRANEDLKIRSQQAAAAISVAAAASASSETIKSPIESSPSSANVRKGGGMNPWQRISLGTRAVGQKLVGGVVSAVTGGGGTGGSRQSSQSKAANEVDADLLRQREEFFRYTSIDKDFLNDGSVRGLFGSAELSPPTLASASSSSSSGTGSPQPSSAQLFLSAGYQCSFAHYRYLT